MLLLAALETGPDAIVDDYLETVRFGDLRAATSHRNNAEPKVEALRQSHGTTISKVTWRHRRCHFQRYSVAKHA